MRQSIPYFRVSWRRWLKPPIRRSLRSSSLSYQQPSRKWPGNTSKSTAPTDGLGDPSGRCSGTDWRITSIAFFIIERESIFPFVGMIRSPGWLPYADRHHNQNHSIYRYIEGTSKWTFHPFIRTQLKFNLSQDIESCQRFPGLGSEPPQTGHTFSVGLIIKVALHLEHLTLWSLTRLISAGSKVLSMQLFLFEKRKLFLRIFDWRTETFRDWIVSVTVPAMDFLITRGPWKVFVTTWALFRESWGERSFMFCHWYYSAIYPALPIWRIVWCCNLFGCWLFLRCQLWLES